MSEPQWNPDRSALLMAVQLSSDQRTPTRGRCERRVQKDYPRARRRAGRRPDGRRGHQRTGRRGLRSAEGISLPVTLVLMLLAFGALIAAGMPVLLAATSVTATMGLRAPVSQLVHAEPTVTSMIVLIGMAVGVDYSLFYLKRERAERAAGRSTLDAVEIAAADLGSRDPRLRRAVIASMAGLFVLGDATFNSPGHRRDHGRRGRRARLGDGAPGPAGEARSLGRPAPGPAALAPQPPYRQRRDQRPAARPGGPTPGRGALVAAASWSRAGRTRPGDEDAPGNLETLPGDIAEVQTFRRHEEFPREGTRAGRRPPGPTRSRRGALDGSTRPPGRPTTSWQPGPPVQVSADGRPRCWSWRCLTRSPTPGRRGAIARSATTWCPALGDLDGGGVRRRRWRSRVPRRRTGRVTGCPSSSASSWC